MKCLVAGYDAPDSFADNVAFTLNRLGHEAFVAPRSLSPGKWRFLLSRGKAWAGVAGVTRLESWLVQVASRMRPEMLIAPTQPIGEEALGRLAALGVEHRVAWWGDPPGNLREMDLMSEAWTLICMKDRHGARKLRGAGLPVEYLPEAMNPEWHRPIGGEAGDRVVIAGNMYGFRQQLVRALSRRGIAFDLYGGRPPRWSVQEVREQHRGRYVVREEKSALFGKALACLNSTSLVEGDSMNCRAFEVAGAAGLQVLEARPCVEEFFEPGRELLVFGSVEECVSHIEWARKEPQAAEMVKRAGAARARAEHTYEHRLRSLFGMIGEKL